MRTLLAAAFVAVAFVACGPPKNYTPVDQIPKIGSLKEVMDVQATAADPQFKKRDQESFTADDWAQFAETAKKIDATSHHIKDFSKGKDFDALADQLNGHAAELGKAADAKDANAARAALNAMKATCKECHSRFR